MMANMEVIAAENEPNIPGNDELTSFRNRFHVITKNLIQYWNNQSKHDHHESHM